MIKKIINKLVLEDLRTQGKITSFIIAAMCFLGIILIGIISMIFILG